MSDELETIKNRVRKLLALSKISNDARQVCKDEIKEIKMESRKIEQPAQNPEQKHGRSL